MKDKFPYPGEPAVITNEMCDLNGHLNVVYYYHIFAQDLVVFMKIWALLVSILKKDSHPSL